MSTKKMVVILISFFIVLIATFIVMSGGSQPNNRTEWPNSYKLAEQKSDVRDLESQFRHCTHWYNDDEDKITEIRDNAIDLKEKVTTVGLKERINTLIKKCNDKL